MQGTPIPSDFGREYDFRRGTEPFTHGHFGQDKDLTHDTATEGDRPLSKLVEEKAVPVQVRFEDIKFSAPLKGRKAKEQGKYKELLSNVTGTFEPGTLTAIMGPSGAGKTTMLNVLAVIGKGRADGKTEGNVYFNGVPREQAMVWLRKIQAYVMQDDLLMRTQTPGDILTFSAMLRLPKSMSKEKKEDRVNTVLSELNISKIKKSEIGGAGYKKGISGGERKRVAIGVELVTNPSLLYLDEPTSGLDSVTAESLISILKQLCQAGRTVICTIHQPSSEMFKLFDRLLLLSGGKVMYNGPANEAVNYFESLGYAIPEYTNPADFVLRLAHSDPTDSRSIERVQYLLDCYNRSVFALKESQKPEAVPPPAITPADVHGRHNKPKLYEASFYTQIYYLCWRNTLDNIREPIKFNASAFTTLFMGLLVGLVYLQIGNDQASIQSRLGALFFVLINQAFASVTGLVNTFPAERGIFIREHYSNMYSTTAYYISKVASDFPFQVIFPIIFAVITYWMIGFKSDFIAFFLYTLVLILSAQVGSALGLLIGIIAPNATAAIAMVPVVIIPFMLFSGFLVNDKTTPVYFIWIPYISFVKYGFEILAINEFRGQTFTCGNNEQYCQIRTGEDELKLLGFNGHSVLVDFVALLELATFVILRILGYIALIWRAKTTPVS